VTDSTGGDLHPDRRTGGAGVIEVVGIGADGWDGLSPRVRDLIRDAQVVVGGPRQLSLVPDKPGQRRQPLPSPLRDGLPGLIDSVTGRRTVVLASGDPLVFGIGGTLVDLAGPQWVRVHPAVSSVSLAAAELGWSSDSFDVIRVVAGLASLRRMLTARRRVLVLSADASTPAAVAGLLAGSGFGSSTMTVLSDLGSCTQGRIDALAADFAAALPTVPPLNVVALRLVGGPERPTVGGLPDEAFEHDGQLTKRDARASALARLAPAPGQLLWDVGAGAGSVAIEWARVDPRCRAIAVEQDPERAARITRNAASRGVPAVSVVTGSAPGILGELPEPDAVFVGGGATVPGVLDACWDALDGAGRLVVHGVTLETETLLVDRHRRFGGELIRLSVERVQPLGSFRGWAPARTIVQWSVSMGATG
jgi:precorrin-6Y C5,15-methyltransferase (decarboxylating)